MRHLMLAALIPLAACGNGFDDDPGIAPNGSGSTRSFAASGFTKVGAAGPDDVVVTVGPAFAVRAEGDPAVLGRLVVKVDGDELEVRRRREKNGVGGKARVFVSLPAIRAASLAGSGNMSVDKAAGDKFDGSIAGSGKLAVAALTAAETEISIAGSGGFTGAGSVQKATVNIAGSGDVAAEGLTATGAEVSIAGSGGVRMRVNGAAEVNIMGSGDVDLGAGARCKVNKMGSGSVRCGG